MEQNIIDHHKDPLSPWVVLKFGGTSVSNVNNWSNIVKIIQDRLEEGLKPIIVCSALSGISNTLEKLAEAAKDGGEGPILEQIFSTHINLAHTMGINYESILKESFEQLKRLSHGISLIGSYTPALKARVLAFGEIFSTQLGHAFFINKGLDSYWIDARSLLTTVASINEPEGKRYLSASCDYGVDPQFKEKFSNSAVHITQGFIAQNPNKETVLLGRGGSDTSASYIASKLKANRLEIWTDVPGMFTTNPHETASARLLLHMDYDEAQELATSGAKVLHPKSIGPVRLAGVPLHIKWTERPDHPGTIIGKYNGLSSPSVKAVSMKSDIQVISMESISMWQQAGFLSDVFACFKQFGISIDLIATSETNVTVTLDRNSNIIDDQILDRLTIELRKFCSLKSFGSCAAVSLVGKNIRANLHKIAPALSAFEDKQIFLVSQSASDLNFTFVVEENEAHKIIRSLHSQFFSSIDESDETNAFGPQWNEIHINKDTSSNDNTERWWQSKRDKLLNIGQQSTPVYVYDLEHMEQQVRSLKALKSIQRFHYAVKANCHPDILRLFYNLGLHFDCVSSEEIKHLRRVLPDLKGSQILFTPNFASISEYEFALKQDCIVTLDNVHPIERHPQVFSGSKILVRVDSGIAKGHHPHVITSGPKSKFGVSHDELKRLSELASSASAQIIGLHAHVGSGILTPETWGETARFLAEVAASIPTVKILDLGGGLGVVEKPGQSPLNLTAVEKHLKLFHDLQPKYELWMEPGRFLTSEGGVLLAEVTQIKRKNGKNFIGINAGMNSLIRPSLYGAWHHICNLSRIEEITSVTADIVGPICESGDVLGHGRKMPISKEGDICLIANAGAYGHVMASHYNLREPAKEIILQNKV